MSLVNNGALQNPAKKPELLPHRPEMDLLRQNAVLQSVQ